MYFKNFIVFGISYKESGHEEREEFIKTNPHTIIENLYEQKKIKGFVNLSTCLRIEYYLHMAEDYSLEELKKDLKSDKIFYKEGHIGVNYLFRVTCGFESIIKGEDQILSQVKKAQQISMETKTSTANTNVIFNKAIELGKKFRNKSQITHNALSLEAITLKFIKNTLGSLENKNILILGVGDLAKDIMELLKKEKHKKLTITNRSHHKALEIKDIYGAEVINFDKKIEEIAKSDIIISVTSAPHTVIKTKEVLPVLDKNKNYVFLDLAVPRDIEKEIGNEKNISLYNIDDIWSVYYNNLEKRQDLVTKYEYMLGEQMINLEKWFEYKKGIRA